MEIKSEEGERHSSSLNGNKLMYELGRKLLHCAYLERRNSSPNALLIIKGRSRLLERVKVCGSSALET